MRSAPVGAVSHAYERFADSEIRNVEGSDNKAMCQCEMSNRNTLMRAARAMSISEACLRYVSPACVTVYLNDGYMNDGDLRLGA